MLGMELKKTEGCPSSHLQNSRAASCPSPTGSLVTGQRIEMQTLNLTSARLHSLDDTCIRGVLLRTDANELLHSRMTAQFDDLRH